MLLLRFFCFDAERFLLFCSIIQETLPLFFVLTQLIPPPLLVAMADTGHTHIWLHILDEETLSDVRDPWLRNMFFLP